MNKLSLDRQAQIIRVLCEGNSIRSTARITDSSINTVVKLLRECWQSLSNYQDKLCIIYHLNKLQIDEIWSFVYSKDKNVPEDKQGQFGYGDVWTFTAIDAETKISPCLVSRIKRC